MKEQFQSPEIQLLALYRSGMHTASSPLRDMIGVQTHLSHRLFFSTDLARKLLVFANYLGLEGSTGEAPHNMKLLAHCSLQKFFFSSMRSCSICKLIHK